MENGLSRHEAIMAARARKGAKDMIANLQEQNRTLEKRVRDLTWLYSEEHHKATHDNLTGLLNKRAMEERIKERIENTQATANFGLFFIDLTNFKRINDERGHQAGDKVLQDVASHIKHIVRREDDAAHYVGRLGGDEFVVLFEDLSSRPEKINDLTPQRRMAMISARFTRSFNEFRTSPMGDDRISLADMGFDVSVGRALWQPGIDAEELISQAEQDMYQHKIIQHNTGGSYR